MKKNYTLKILITTAIFIFCMSPTNANANIEKNPYKKENLTIINNILIQEKFNPNQGYNNTPKPKIRTNLPNYKKEQINNILMKKDFRAIESSDNKNSSTMIVKKLPLSKRKMLQNVLENKEANPIASLDNYIYEKKEYSTDILVTWKNNAEKNVTWENKKGMETTWKDIDMHNTFY